MVWELGQDSFDDTSLLQAIHSSLPDSKLYRKAKKARKRLLGTEKKTKKSRNGDAGANKHEL